MRLLLICELKDATERLRRINVAQRFLAFFIKGK